MNDVAHDFGLPPAEQALNEFRTLRADYANKLGALKFRRDFGGETFSPEQDALFAQLEANLARAKVSLGSIGGSLEEAEAGVSADLRATFAEMDNLLARFEGREVAAPAAPADTPKARYLANLLLLSRADGSRDAREDEVFARAMRGIGAGQEDAEAAHALVAAGSHGHLAPVGRFSDQVRNLEDLMLLCFADESIHPAEQELIETFAGSIGLDQDAMDRVHQSLQLSLQPAT